MSQTPAFWSEVARVVRLAQMSPLLFLLKSEAAGSLDPRLPWGHIHPTKGLGSAWPGLPGAPGISGHWGCLAAVPVSQFSEGQANRQGQGLPGLAKWDQFSGFGDFEPAAVAGVVGLAEQSPPAVGRVASQLLEGVGRPAWPLAQAAKSAESGRGWGWQEAPIPHVVHHCPHQSRDHNPASLGPTDSQGGWLALGLGLKPQVLSPMREILTIREEAQQGHPPPPVLPLSFGWRAPGPLVLCLEHL